MGPEVSEVAVREMIDFERKKIGELECVLAAGGDSTDRRPDAVVILCHGFGAPGTDLVPLGGELLSALRAGFDDRLDLRFIFPAAPIELDPMFDSRAWWMIDIEKIQDLMARGEVREMRTSSPEELPACRQKMMKVIEFAKENYGVTASQIVIGGFSQGSMLSTDVALHVDETLGGLIVWSGALICEQEWTDAATRQPELQIAQSHGRFDPVLPFAGAGYLRDMLTAQGHAVDFVEFDGQHAIPGPAIEMALRLIKSVVERTRADA